LPPNSIRTRFHLREETARDPFFKGLAASGSHTAAMGAVPHHHRIALRIALGDDR
jgi:hypothetical protein